MNFKEFFEGRKLFEELMQLDESAVQRDYAVDMLEKITKVAEYLIKSRLDNPNDLARFEKFLSMMNNEMPKLEKTIKSIQADIRNVNSNQVTQSPRRFNYNK